MFVVCSLALAACSPLHRSVPETDLIRAGRHLVVAGIELPEVSGAKGCGAQALAAAIAFVQPQQSPESLAAELPWHDDGATPVDLLLEARRRGCRAVVLRGDLSMLKSNLLQQQPILIMLDAGLEVRSLFFRYPTPNVMHWAVVSGIARDDSEVLLAAEGNRHYIVKQSDLLRRWGQSDFCMITVTSDANAAPKAERTDDRASGH